MKRLDKYLIYDKIFVLMDFTILLTSNYLTKIIMKKIINNVLKTAFVLSFMFFGAVFADAANFDQNPYGGSTDFASINDCIGDCANHDDDLSVNIPNSGDSETFHVFLDFRNESSGTITNPTGRITYPTGEQTGSSATFDGRLSGGGASAVNDTTRLSGLPDQWEIEFVSGYVDVPEHYSGSTSCSALYGINFSYEDNFSNPGNVSIDNDLRYQYGDGWCDQGFVIATFKVTNTESNDPEYTYTWETSSWGSCINGVKYRDVWCEQNPGGDEVSSSNCSGAMPSTSTTVGCSNNDDTLSVDTDAPNINDYSVTLNGEIQSGSSNNHYFVLGDGPNISCNSLNGFGSDDIQTIPSSQDGNTLSAGEDFSHYISYLSDGDYWYIACAGLDSDPASGIVRDFTIDGGSTPNGSDPEAETEDEDDVDEDSATLEGKIRMNDFDNGFVFFVYGQDESDVEDVEDEDEYSDIDEDGDNLQKEEVDDNNDEDGWESYDLDINGLDTDERYYYRICVEYDNDDGDEELVCGDVEDFKTDDDGNNDDSDIETRTPDSISETSAKICGDLNDDGGDSNLRTWMEYRKSTSSSYTRTDKVDRGEGYYCETIRNLSPDTRYTYRACSDDGCASTRTFTTDGDNEPSGEEPIVTTDNVYNVRSNSAVLPGTYVTNANSGTVWFQYGRSEVLNRETRRYTKYGSGGGYVHNFTGLKSNQRYCYRAMIQTVNGTDYGSTKCFVTQPYTPGPGPVDPEPPVIEVVEEDDDFNIDLSQLGLGLSLIRLEIDDDRETVTKNENVTYEITWENISEIDLDDLDLNITIPREVQITSSSRGRLDQDRNAIFYTIDDLEAGEENSMTVTGIVNNGNLGDALTADATIAFDNPINDAQENATDYDVDEYVVPIAGVGTASVFGLANITFLGWLTILLGLFIVFLVARWLYLEREELRAQAYVNGYGRTPYMAPVDNRYDYIEAPRAPVREARYVEPVAPAAPAAPQGDRPDYRPYRPNR